MNKKMTLGKLRDMIKEEVSSLLPTPLLFVERASDNTNVRVSAYGSFYDYNCRRNPIEQKMTDLWNVREVVDELAEKHAISQVIDDNSQKKVKFPTSLDTWQREEDVRQHNGPTFKTQKKHKEPVKKEKKKNSIDLGPVRPVGPMVWPTPWDRYWPRNNKKKEE